MSTESVVGDDSPELDLRPFMGQMSEMEALAIQGILDAGGVPFTTFGNTTLPVTDFSINVPAARLDEARQLVDAAQAAGPAAAEEAERQSEMAGVTPELATAQLAALDEEERQREELEDED